MDNQSNQFFTEKEHRHTQHYGAHSGSRSGLSDYHDGEDDHYSPKPEDAEELEGRTAFGNDNDGDEEDYGKFHSGL